MSKKKKKENSSSLQKRLLIIGIIICLLTLVVSAYICLNKLITDQSCEDKYQKILDENIEAIDTEDETDDPEVPFKVDFEALQAINPDIIGWIYIPCLDISYPIVQGEDNDEYLHQTAYKEYLFAGSIMLDVDNSKYFTDPHSVIYGHNMKNGTMFGILWHITGQDAAKDDPYFWIFTPTITYRYKMFSAFGTTPSSEVYNFTLKRDRTFVEWCYKMLSYSYVDFGEVSFDKNSRIVTLSTCGSTSATRTVVLGYQDKSVLVSSLSDSIYTIGPQQ